MRARNPGSTALILSMMLLVASATTIGRPAAQQEAELWIHLESIGDSRVYLNLPLAAIETLVALAPDTIFEDGHPRLTRDVPVAGIRETWRELRDVGGAEFVTIPNRGPNVWRIAREGDTILVDVSVRRWFRSDWVRVEIPWRVADALDRGLEVVEAAIRGSGASLKPRRTHPGRDRG